MFPLVLFTNPRHYLKRQQGNGTNRPLLSMSKSRRNYYNLKKIYLNLRANPMFFLKFEGVWLVFRQDCKFCDEKKEIRGQFAKLQNLQAKKGPLGRRAKGMPDEVRARKYAY